MQAEGDFGEISERARLATEFGRGDQTSARGYSRA